MDFNEYEYLCHHGIQGMKWGVRRYQDKDGRLTAEGRARYTSLRNSNSNTRAIAKSINKQVLKDSKPPTGNQNCQLCTWCAEAAFRGFKDCLPRPVYSPRDPELQIRGETIVKNPEKSYAKNFDELRNKIQSIDGDARFYAHVNWSGSSGGHEFLLIKSGSDISIMDPQAGSVTPMTKNSIYFSGINYKNSYVSRLDNKEFDEKLFRKVNDRKNVMEFDPKLDIPFMYKEGMLSKDEYEAVMKDPMILYTNK